MSAELIYRRVPVGIWTALAGLSDAAVVLLMRLRTGPETCSIPGLVVAGRAGLAEALGWPVRRLDAAARELEGPGLIRVDWTARTIWLPAAIVETPPANPNMVAGWRSAWAQVPPSPLRDQVRRELWTNVAGRGDTYRQALVAAIGEAPVQPSGESFPEPSPPTIRGTVSRTVGEIGSGSGVGKGKGGGGGSGAAPTAEIASQEQKPDPVEVALAAIRTVRDRRVKNYPEVTTAEPDTDVAELRATLRKLSPEDLRRAPKAAWLFYQRSGRTRDDAFWSRGRWSLHLLASQGIEACLPDVRSRVEIGIDGWPGDGYVDDDVNRAVRELARKADAL